jgi:TrmH family RNA methyltransferase
MLSKKIVKYIQSLSHKKEREEQNCFVAEGPKVITELLTSDNLTCRILCAEQEWISGHDTLLKNISPENIFEIDEIQLQKISLLKTPNKVVAVFEKRPENLLPEILNRLTLLLDDINDPGNLGTIIRISDWFGIENIICSPDCVECYNPKVVQSTMGSIARVNVIYNPLPDFIERNAAIPVYAASLTGIPVQEFKNITEGMILFGNESKGINEVLKKMANKEITIPKYGYAESLNAAVAAGIILSHLRSS